MHCGERECVRAESVSEQSREQSRECVRVCESRGRAVQTRAEHRAVQSTECVRAKIECVRVCESRERAVQSTECVSAEQRVCACV